MQAMAVLMTESLLMTSFDECCNCFFITESISCCKFTIISLQIKTKSLKIKIYCILEKQKSSASLRRIHALQDGLEPTTP